MIYADYTIVLKTLLDDPESKVLIDKALSTYPLYTAKNEPNFTKILNREELNKKILDHFKYREIGSPTFGRFLDELEIAMNEIMPYYNQKFCSEDIINGLEDIFGNLDVTEEFEQETTGTSTDNTTLTGSDSQEHSETSTTGSEVSSTSSDTSETNTTMNSDGKHVKTDTPQSQISVPAQNMDSITHASEVNWNKDNSTSKATNTGTASSESSSETSETKSGTISGTKNETTENNGTTAGTTKHTLHRKGNQGVNTYAHDMLEFRSLFMNIVQEIINDKRIQELFMGVY